MAPQHPEWKDNEPFKSVLAVDLKGALAGGYKALIAIDMKKDWRRVFSFE
jgi:hypothetical protein